MVLLFSIGEKSKQRTSADGYFVHFVLTQNGLKSQEDFNEIFGPAKTMDATIASFSFSPCETHFRW
ncbi:hypothetical protein [Croceitalea sp. P059]|uniref:hypothetical protein n=1 Tax=Croceitalea sp. P059 TaxID=3075601 RepID=UPI002888BD10|nr:hypothetical protein [Croceitalea sp. P059]MDT0538870.1 hypothetical protein [Croceitalea sp. P059]